VTTPRWVPVIHAGSLTDLLEQARDRRGPSLEGCAVAAQVSQSLGERRGAGLGRGIVRRVHDRLESPRHVGRRIDRGGQLDAKCKRDEAGASAASLPARHCATLAISLLVALAGQLPANNRALGGAKDDGLAAGQGCRVGGRGEGQDGGLDQKCPDHDKRNAVPIPAKPPHRLRVSPGSGPSQSPGLGCIVSRARRFRLV
jgi:hypothetical protein